MIARRPTLLSLRRRASSVLAIGAALAVVCASPSRARADGALTIEVGGGESKPPPTIQPSAFEYQRVSGRIAPVRAFTLGAGLRLQHDFMAAPTPGTKLRSGSDWVWLGAIDGTLELSDHASLTLSILASPSATRTIASSFVYPRGASDAVGYARTRASSSSLGAGLTFTYDTFDDDAPERALDGSFDLSAAYTTYATDQAMVEIDGPNGATSVDAFMQNECAAATTRTALCDVVARAARAATSRLGQARLGAAATATLFERTDVTLDGAYYVYDQGDPDSVGFFQDSITSGGRQATASYGVGLPLLPPRWSLRGDVSHKWSTFLARGFYQFTDYTLAGYVGHSLGGKAQLYFGKWRAHATGSYRWDVSTADTAKSWILGLGLTRTF